MQEYAIWGAKEAMAEEDRTLKGVILAAGQGTRLRPLTERRPKPLVPILDRPLLDHILEGMRAAGVTHLALLVDYKAEMIRERYGDGNAFGLQIEYIQQQGARGTGAATLLAKDFVGEEPFFLSWGDVVVAPENYASFVRLWHEEQPEAILGVNWIADPWEGAAVYLDQAGYVQRIVEKPSKGTSTTNYNNAGLFILRPEIFLLLEQCPLSPRGEIEFPDAIQALLRLGRRIRGVAIEGYWGDVARPVSIIELDKTIVQYRSPEGMICGEKVEIHPKATMRPPLFIGGGCQLGACLIGPDVYLAPGTRIGDGAELERVVAFGDCEIGENCQLKNVIVEDGVRLSAYAIVGDEHAPVIIQKPDAPHSLA